MVLLSYSLSKGYKGFVYVIVVFTEGLDGSNVRAISVLPELFDEIDMIQLFSIELQLLRLYMISSVNWLRKLI
jgi:hypothetical protein